MRRREGREGVANFELEEEGQKTFFPPHRMRMEEKMRMEKRENRRQEES